MALFNNMGGFRDVARAGALGGAIGGAGSLFGSPGRPYERASEELDRYLPQAEGYQRPFYEAGTRAIPQFEEFLNERRDPSQFINKLMEGYQESPHARYLTDRTMRAARNRGSAEGTIGSTPMARFMQQEAGNIASGDIQNFLSNVLGVSQQRGQGLQSLMGGGQQSANQLLNLLSSFAGEKAGLRYGEEAAEQGGIGNLLGGLGNLAMFAML